MSRDVRRRSQRDVSALLCVEVFADWLAEHCTREDLARQVRQTFDHRGPVLSRRMRRELDVLVNEQSGRTLAECIAINQRPEDDDAFVRWCRDIACDSPDPYVHHGVSRRDFL